jgi:predicted acylesterase/phospholipase RssA
MANDLLPRVLSGASAGSIVSAMIAILSWRIDLIVFGVLGSIAVNWWFVIGCMSR